MAKIIGVVNQKGGTGKTTTAVNLAGYLAALGKYTLLVDLDPQGNATSGLGFEQENLDGGIYEVLSGTKKPEEVIKKTKVFGFEILPATSDLAGAAIELVSHPDREFILKKALGRIRTNYDYILIDCPPSLSLLTVNGLLASDELLIPVQAEYYALEGLGQLFNTVNLINESIDSPIKIKGALLTMYDKRNRLARQVSKEVQQHFPGYVFDSNVPRCVKLAEAPSHGKIILQYNPKSKGARAYKNLAQEVIKLDSAQEKID